MKTIGSVESLWRYPVKSMAGEEIDEIFMGFPGFFGDRIFGFKKSGARKGFPYLSATSYPKMLAFQPQFRDLKKTLIPPNLFEAMNISPGVNPSNADPDDIILDIITPSGKVVSIDDPLLIEILKEGLDGENQITLIRSDRSLTDCRPISMISLQTVQKIESELNKSVDQRRFRANIYLTLNKNNSFNENTLVGRRLRIGSKAEIMVLEKDPRCKMISIDPDTCEHDPEVLRVVAQKHDNFAGVYCAVLVEGILTKGDSISVLD